MDTKLHALLDDKSHHAISAVCAQLTVTLNKMLTHETKLPTPMLKQLGYGNTLLQVLTRFAAFHVVKFAHETGNHYDDLAPSFISEFANHLVEINKTFEANVEMK